MLRRGYNGPVKYNSGVVTVFQNGIGHLEDMGGLGFARGGIATVLKAYSEKNTCDIRSWNGAQVNDVPVMTSSGVVNGEVYGTLDLPNEGDIVVVDLIGDLESQPVIVGTVIPFLHNTWQNGTPVNSSRKSFTKKLLERNKNNNFRRIFKSGVSVEVEEDGTVVVEKPDGTYFLLDSDGTFTITDANDNTIYSQNRSVFINDNLEVEQ